MVAADSSAASSEAPPANGHAEAASEAAGNHVKKNKAEKLKEKKQRQKLNKQRRKQEQEEYERMKQQQEQQQEQQAVDDIIIEYVTAPPDLDFLREQQQKAEAAPDANGGERGGEDADADAEADANGAPGLGLGFGGGGLGLGFGGAGGLGFSTPAGLGFGGSAGLGSSTAATTTTASVEAAYEELKAVLDKFSGALEPSEDGAGSDAEADGDAGAKGDADGGGGAERAAGGAKATTSDADSDGDSDDEGGREGKLSKKQRKLLHRMKIAQLKQQCARPEVVEVWDVTAPDPQLLVFLKAYRNTVPVPRHWSQKRKYLQGKRGIEKPPFKLPSFIEATGISEMRQAYQEKEEGKKLKQKQKERMQPKVGKMDIDYAVLHDAFFKHQSKPKLTELGELYYEGKEFEATLEGLRPGRLSAELREALGVGDDAPPPWLINMQRYGPPPSYPDLKIPGLNAPIPAGASFGYQPGGWGKPPVDESGRPLYGDVFALAGGGGEDSDEEGEVERGARWGELESDVEESEEEEEEEEESEADADDADLAGGIATDATGFTTATGAASSLASGIETPDGFLNLRKSSDSLAGTESAQHPQLFTVLEQRKTALSGGLLGTDHVYVVPGAGGAAGGGGDDRDRAPRIGEKRRADALRTAGATMAPSDVEVTLLPEELEGLDEAAVRQLYEERVAAAKAAAVREDFSDLVAAQAAAQKRKMAKIAETKASKKQKDSFKF